MRIIAVIKYALESSSLQLLCSKYGPATAGGVTVPGGDRGQEHDASRAGDFGQHRAGPVPCGQARLPQVSGCESPSWVARPLGTGRTREGILCAMLVLMQTLWRGAQLLWVRAFGVLLSLVVPACLLAAFRPLISPTDSHLCYSPSMPAALQSRAFSPELFLLRQEHLPHVSYHPFPKFLLPSPNSFYFGAVLPQESCLAPQPSSAGPLGSALGPRRWHGAVTWP